jgi:hypothetical protein
MPTGSRKPSPELRYGSTPSCYCSSVGDPGAYEGLDSMCCVRGTDCTVPCGAPDQSRSRPFPGNNLFTESRQGLIYIWVGSATPKCIGKFASAALLRVANCQTTNQSNTTCPEDSVPPSQLRLLPMSASLWTCACPGMREIREPAHPSLCAHTNQMKPITLIQQRI